MERGLIGPREAPRVWDRHILNCALIERLIPSGAAVADIGSGAGLPGLALALARPDVTMTLVEPLLRRVTWLTEVIDDLGLKQVTVRRARAEDLAGQLTVDVVTARAVAALPQLAAWCLPLLHGDGRLLAIKGERAAEELESSRHLLPASAGRSHIETCTAPGVDDPTIVTVIYRR